MADDDRTQQRKQEGKRSPPPEVVKIREAARLQKYAEGAPKHYVRKIGWIEPVKQYVQQMRDAGEDRPIKYFTLPGLPALDIGVMYEADLIHREGGRWPHVAICDRENAADVINNLGEFAAVSDGWLHEELKRQSSPLANFFPVDVVNLDFYGSFIKEGKEETTILRNVETLKRVVHLQMGQGFLLLLTHKVSDSEYTSAVKANFRPLLEDNLANERFKRPYQIIFGGDDPMLCMTNVLQLGLLAVPKNVANMARQMGYCIEEQFVGWYSRDDEDYQMAVHSIVFRQAGNNDPAKNYSPRYKSRRIFESSFSSLPDEIQNSASEGYWSFVSQLPSRQVLDITATVSTNRDFADELTRDSQRMQDGWWRNIRDKDAQTE